MKKNILLLVLFNTLVLFSSIAQSNQIKPVSKGVYMVVGAFQKKSNAINFKNNLQQSGSNPSICYSDETLFYYVYLKTYDSKEEAKSQVSMIRTNTPFDGAWVLAFPSESEPTTTVTINEHKGAIVEGNMEDVNEEEVEVAVTEEIIPALPIPEKPKEVVEAPVIITLEDAKTDKNQYKMIFHTYNSLTDESVGGKVDIIDPDRLKLVRSVDANELSYINEPHNQSNSLQFIAEIFGYKKAQLDLNLNDGISEPFLTVVGDTMVLDFPLIRYRKGDVAIMYNVFFYKDAAIMKPESQFEVNSLLEMLEENPTRKVLISGHTNGNSSGTLIEIGDDVKEYFSLSSATKEGHGSAKKLSLKRAEIIRRYMVDNGIEESRMEVKGWGGSKPLYDKFDRLAAKNVRVEVEILQD